MLKIIFAGTPQFAIPTLERLLNSDHRICAVYTQPDRPAGRGQKLAVSPVKEFALKNGLPIYQPASLKDPAAQQQLQKLEADVLVNVAYGLLLPQIVLTAPKFGCVNLHPSLLPRWRGAAPIQRAILNGDQTTGITIMKMDIGLDTGDIYEQTILPITDQETSLSLAAKAATLGAEMMLEVLDAIATHTVTATPQDDHQSTYAKKITKEEGKIDWHKSAIELERMVRAFNPWPIAYFSIGDNQVRLWEAKVKSAISNMEPGTIIHLDRNGIDVATADGILSLCKIQFPGGRPVIANDIVNAQHNLFIVGGKIF
jgi:methionyl-tRNA formyltransferase